MNAILNAVGIVGATVLGTAALVALVAIGCAVWFALTQMGNDEGDRP